ncbi:MAG: hypothetical protein IPH41_08340 [Sulfuritalea sp.]|nr:hypothetical protein [Sulfuritalea sp.]
MRKESGGFEIHLLSFRRTTGSPAGGAVQCEAYLNFDAQSFLPADQTGALSVPVHPESSTLRLPVVGPAIHCGDGHDQKRR